MSITWNEIWETHPDVFIVNRWKEYPEDKKKSSRLPPQYAYFMGGETTLRVGIIAALSINREEEFLLAGLLWGHRLSNGAKTVIYYVAPDFTPSFLTGLSKIGGTIDARAVYWREKLTPSLYPIPDRQQLKRPRYTLGEERPDWKRWGKGLNPVARQQLVTVNDFFHQLSSRQVRTIIKNQTINFLWGNFEVAEVRRKGKKFELNTKVKWLKIRELTLKWHKQGWVDSSGSLNSDFCSAVLEVLDYLESLEQEGKLRPYDHLELLLHQGAGAINLIWGSPWAWPWLPKDRGENCVSELEEWFFFQGNGQLSVVCPIFEKPLLRAARSILLASVLEGSMLLVGAKDNHGNPLAWDGRVHWLTTLSKEEELRRCYCWLNDEEKFPIWTLPANWQEEGIYQLNCQSNYFNHSLMQKDYLSNSLD
ncbi:hypothetical protein Desor_3467 [Desulfosporosinus orientis DSM 765]|uniref:Uncharacterized protein n=1 Tax=Desulfosporosinus orientis (strain ATCC 19365 / DSM 765 / NCIMB 8382 / VKM B-1628 / Singapore I) TaxID=768706 RepID=G7WFT3_DESOD|nr:hypothetical protein [Desulfosporosinus orientis]AET68956.1 hypothetical protein Desor_3467 [Desulfosporosinus orientis DSM 765]